MVEMRDHIILKTLQAIVRSEAFEILKTLEDIEKRGGMMWHSGRRVQNRINGQS